MSDQQDSATASQSGPSNNQSVNVQQVKSQLVNKFQPNKGLVLKLHSVLTWEQDLHPILIGVAVTISFIIIHLLNSSVLTTLSYLGIVAALVDLAMPTIVKNLCSSCGPQAKFSEKDNQRFDKVCMDLAKVYAFFRNSCNTCCSLKTTKPKIYYPALLITLLVLAWTGNRVNNLFITWLVTLFVALYPGLDKKGLPQKAMAVVLAKLGRAPAGGPAGDRRGSGKRN